LNAYAVTTMAKKSSVIGRIEAFFRANVGKIVSNAEIRKAAIDPDTGLEPENWHQGSPSCG